MKRLTLAVLFCVLVCYHPCLSAQERPKTEEKSDAKRDITPVRVQVVIAEYDGEKKISNLPYTLLLNAENPRGEKASIRMGVRVPIATSPNIVQHQDLGA